MSISNPYLKLEFFSAGISPFGIPWHFKIEIQTLCISNVVLCKADDKYRTSVLLVSSNSQNYFINSESKLNMLKMLNLIIFHVHLQVQFIKHKLNFCTCTCKHTCSSTRTRRRTRSNA